VYRWVIDKGIPRFASGGRFEGYIGSCIDITERKHMEREQTCFLETERVTRRQLETVLDVLPAAVIIADAQGQLVHVNQALRDAWGEHTLAADIDEYRIYRGWHPDGRPMATEDWAMTRALQHGETVRGQEVEIQAFDDTHKTILNNAAPLSDEEGAVIGGVVACVDITERKELEHARTEAALLSALSQQFRTLAEHSPDCIARLDPSGRHLYVNPAEANLLGLPAEQWIGKTCADLGIPQDPRTSVRHGTRRYRRSSPRRSRAPLILRS
jgi:PAS domain S-box-containing protein